MPTKTKPDFTRARLKALGVCSGQIKIFHREWPKGCNATQANCLRAVDLGISLWWMVKRLTNERLVKDNEPCLVLDTARNLFYSEWDARAHRAYWVRSNATCDRDWARADRSWQRATGHAFLKFYRYLQKMGEEDYP